MSSQTVTKKRKSADVSVNDAKRAKVLRSAERPAPRKSALEKADAVDSTTTKPSSKKEAASKSNKSQSKKADSVRLSTDVAQEGENDGGVELSADQTADLLAGFSSSDEDEDEGIAISSLPQAPTTGLIQKRINQAISEQDDPETTPGVIYIGRVPHGFFEPQMKAYFSQFGAILNMRLGRNKKTGKSQHHAFVEFASAAVADIVVKTMDKYLLFGHILQVRRVPREQVKENIFRDAGRRRKPAPRNKLEGGKLKRGATREVWEKRVEMENNKRAQKMEKSKEMGYEFDMPVLKAVSEVPVKPKTELLVTDAESLEEPQNGESVMEKVVEVHTEPDGDIVTETTTSKKRAASGKTQTKKVVKKVKA